MSDKDALLKWFKTHKFLTVTQAIHKLGVYNARSRISEIPSIVRSHYREVAKRNGKIARIAVYKLCG